MGKSTGKVIASIVGFAIGGIWSNQLFGTSSWFIGGLYGAALTSNIWSATHQPKYDNKQTYNFDQLMNQVDPNTRIPLIYGTRKWAGQQTWHNASSDKQTLTKDIVWCEGDIDSISDVRANDLSINTTYKTNTLYDYGGMAEATHELGGTKYTLGDITWTVEEYIPGKYRGYRIETIVDKQGLDGCSYTFSNGSISASPPDNYSTVGGYRCMAWSRFVLKASDKLTGSNPTVTAVIKGKKVTDTRTGTYAYSNTPAMCVRDYLLSKRYGAGHFISAAMLDEDSFKEIADYNDALVTTRVPTTLATADAIQAKITELQRYLTYNQSQLSSDEQTKINDEIASLTQSLNDVQNNPVEYTLDVSPRHSLNIIITETKSHQEILQDMLAVFGGFLVYTNGKVSLRCEKQTPVSYAFNNDNIYGKPDYTEYPIDQTPNRYYIKFYDPSNEWTGVKVLVEDTVAQKAPPIGVGKIIPKDVDLVGCTSQAQALRLARLYRDKNLCCPGVVQWTTGMQAMHLEPGDVVTLSWKYIDRDGNEQWLYKDLPVRILQIAKENGTYTLKGEQYNDSIYNDSLGAQIQVKNYVQIPDPLCDVVPQVTNLTISEDSYVSRDGTVLTNIDISYTSVKYQFFRDYEVYYDINLSGQWIAAGKNLDIIQSLNNMVGKSVRVGIITVNSTGRKSKMAISNVLTCIGKSEPPPDVTNFTVGNAKKTLYFKWAKVLIEDLKCYEIREGSSWDTSSLVAQPTDAQYETTLFTAGDKTYWIKAIDRSGNYSVNPVSYSLTVIDAPDTNVVLAISELINGTLPGFYMDNTWYMDDDKYMDSPVIMEQTFNVFLNDWYIDDKYYMDDFLMMDTLMPIDLGSIMTFNLLLTPIYWSDPGAKITVEYQTSYDNVIWTDWIEYAPSTVTTRYLNVMVKIKSVDGVSNAYVKAVTINIDVPDVIEQNVRSINAVGWTKFTFDNKFHEMPTMYVVSQTYDALAYYRNQTKEGFEAILIDRSTGNPVVGSFYYNVKGW